MNPKRGRQKQMIGADTKLLKLRCRVLNTLKQADNFCAIKKCSLPSPKRLLEFEPESSDPVALVKAEAVI